MKDIHIKNGINLYTNDYYMIYQMYTLDGEEYYMSIPNNINSSEYTMIIDFKEEYYNSLLKKELLEQIKNRCDLLYKNNPKAIYVLPNVSTYELNDALHDNDNHSYEYLFNRLQKYTNNTYYTLINNGINISQTITIITETDDDKKFMHWLEMTKGSFFKSIDINLLEESNDPFGNPTKSGNSVSSDKTMANTQSKPKVKVLAPKNSKKGFSNIYFIIITLLLSIIIGIGIALKIYL